MTMKKKYLLCPGYVRSKEDGELHWIDVPTLAKLYGVPMIECMMLSETQGRRATDLIPLPPRGDGDYSLPSA